MFKVQCCLLLVVGALCGGSEGATWYGDLGGETSLPCPAPASTPDLWKACVWTFSSAADSTPQQMTMADVASGVYPGVSRDDSVSCGVRLTGLTLDSEGSWTCSGGAGADLQYQLYINYASSPKMFLAGSAQTHDSSVHLPEAEDSSWQCIVDRARPAVAVRWLAFYAEDTVATDCTHLASTATYLVDGTWLTHTSSQLTLEANAELRSLRCSVSHVTSTGGGEVAVYVTTDPATQVLSAPQLFWEGVATADMSSVSAEADRQYHLSCAVDRARPAADIRWYTLDGSLSQQTDVTHQAVQTSYTIGSSDLRHVSSVLPLTVSSDHHLAACSVSQLSVVSAPVQVYINTTRSSAAVPRPCAVAALLTLAITVFG